VNISKYSIDKPIFAVIIIAALSLLGAFSVSELPLLFLPEYSPPFLMIFVEYKSTSPKEVERDITIPIEGVLGGIRNLKTVSSTSSSDSSRIRLEFEVDTDMDLAAMDVRDRIDRIKSKLPDDVKRIAIRRWQTTDMPIINMSLAWNGPQSELNTVAERVILPRILRVEGVADVDLQGVQGREILIELNSNLMKSHGVTVSMIKRSLQANNLNLAAGTVVEGQRKYLVRSIGEFTDPKEISLLPISGSKVKLGDLGAVAFTYPEKEYYQRLNQQNAVSLHVYKSSTANIVEVSRRVKEVVAQIQADPSMEKLTMATFFDQSIEITRSLDSLKNAGIAGGILAIVMLFLFLLKFRSTLIIGLAIPISILCTFTFMYLLRRVAGLNITLNIISLSGLMLAVGMLVDNSVVVLENIYRHKEEGMGPYEAAVRGASEVAMPVSAATLTTIIVFVPLIFTSHSTFGRFMSDFGLSIVIALVASLFVALTLIPLISSRILTGPEKGKHRVIRKLISLYSQIICWTIKHRVITLVSVLIVLSGGVFLFTRIEREFVPPSPTRRMDISLRLPRSYDINATKSVFDLIEGILMADKDELEIQTLSANYRATRGRLTIFFRELEESRHTTNELWNMVRSLLPELPGVEIKIGRGWGMSGDEMGFSVDIKGPDSEMLSMLAEEAVIHLGEIQGVKDLDTNLESGDEEIQLTVDRNKVTKYGISSQEVAQAISSNLAETTSGDFKTQDEEVPINIQLKEEDRATFDQLKQIRIGEREKEVPLGTLIERSQAKGPISIQRDTGDQVVTVSANTDRRGMSTLQQQVQSQMSSFNLPAGYSWQEGQNFRRFQESQQTSQFAIILAVVFVYIVMASLFESFVHPVTILFSLPFSIIGVSVLFYLTKTTLNNTSWLGIMVLFGIVVNNGILLIDHINRLRSSGLSREQAIIRGGQDRLRPILMTALTTLLGLAPMVATLILPQLFGSAEGRAGMYGPIALALVGGLITSTFLTLVITPTIYSLMDDLGKFIKRIICSVST
jgi:HAE1 family hydrophobic/amphiphilic exporter-1